MMCTNNKSEGKRNRNLREKIDSSRSQIEKFVHFQDSSQSCDKSSSSSLSWGEDCEQEATIRVKYEYERMLRVLRGLEPIPPNYDKDEYKIWIKTFPSIRATIQTNTRKRSYPTTPLSMRTSQNKPGIINDFLSSIYNQIPKAKVKPENQTDCLQRDFESFLRISPAPILHRRIDSKLNFNTSLIEEEFTSLPHLTPKVNSKGSDLNRKRRKAKNLVLPKIENTVNQFRSVSAMPLHGKSDLDFEIRNKR